MSHVGDAVPVYQAGANIWLDLVDIGPVAAHKPQIGVDNPLGPKELIQHLFSTSPPSHDEQLAWDGKPSPSCKTYAILDAAILPQLPEILETSGLQYKCLFSGKALEELGDSAPWLVQLDPAHALTRKLMTAQADGGFWDLYLGFYIVSRQPLEAVWRHLRKFTRIKDDADQWFFNRFWSAPVSTGLLQFGNSADLSQFVSPLFPAERDALRLITVSAYGCAVLSRIPGTNPPTARPILTNSVRLWLRHLRRFYQFEELIEIALRHVAKKTPIDPPDCADRLRGHRDQFFDIGFWRRDHLTMLCVWETMLGPDFIETYGGGEILRILRTSSQDWEAVQRISDYLEPPDEPTEAEIIAQMHAVELARKAEKALPKVL